MAKRLCIVAVGAACVLLALTLAFGGDRSSGGAPAGESATPGQAVHAVQTVSLAPPQMAVRYLPAPQVEQVPHWRSLPAVQAAVSY